MGFTKLDEGILQSSIMAEKPDVFKVWIALLASCGSDGISKVSSIFLSSACHLSLKAIDRAIEILSLPDTRSRSLADEGRRIKRVDGGYFIVNYEKYRKFSYSDNPESVRKREYRERKEDGVSGHFGTCPGHSASASASASASVLELDKEFALFWELYPIHVAKQDALKAFKALRRKGITWPEIESATMGYRTVLKRKETPKDYVQYPATFLRNEKWKDYLGIKDRPSL
jgi:hypothetical protein